MFLKEKLSSFTKFFVLLALVGSTTLIALAAAPSGGYGPGDTLDPDCAPAETDCLVNLGWFRTPSSSVSYNSSDRIGIGTSTPAASALLDLDSSSLALLVPRNSDPDGNVSSPVNGMIAYDSGDNELQGYVNGSWTSLTGGGGGGGSVAVNEASLTLSAAQLDSLNATPIQMVAAQGVGTIIKPISVVVEYNHGTVSYTGGFSPPPLGVAEDTSGSSSILVGANIIGKSSDAVFLGSIGNDPRLLENTPLYAWVSADLSDGDGDVVLHVEYTVISI